MNKEVWRQVVGYEGYYEVSSIGRVRGEDRLVPGRWGMARYKGKLLSPESDKDGYKKVVLCKDGVKRKHLVHRLVGFAFLGESNGLVINHKNGLTADNCIDNLEWVTLEENARHSVYVLKNATPIKKKALIAYVEGVERFFMSGRDAERQGFNRIMVRRCVSGRYDTYKGYKWRYADS